MDNALGLETVAEERDIAGEDAFAELYRQHSPRVLRLCRHLLGSEDAARDATSEAFLRAQRAFDSYDRSRPVEHWLLAIAGNHCLDQLRRRQVERRLFLVQDAQEAELPEPPARTLSPLSQLLAREQKARLRSALEELPARSRAALVLRYDGELSYHEIAAAMGVPRSEVGVVIFRAKQQLRRLWERKNSKGKESRP